jgi:hypothetical protein
MKHLGILMMYVLLALTVTAQKDEKNDIVFKANGDELTGKVKEINDADIKFSYVGETLVYSIKKSDILKIAYASGRVETFNKEPLVSGIKNDSQAAPIKNNIDHRNRVAVLPFRFIADRQSVGDDMSYAVQTECYTYLSRHAGELTILDPRTTNALLIKAGVTEDKLMGFTMDELCNILGVEYIIDGTITQNKGSLNSYQNDDYKASSGANSKSGKNEGKISGSSSSSTTQNYETSISINIYNDQNKNIFSQVRKSFWTTNDAYKITLEYLLKKSPLYTK